MKPLAANRTSQNQAARRRVHIGIILDDFARTDCRLHIRFADFALIHPLQCMLTLQDGTLRHELFQTFKIDQSLFLVLHNSAPAYVSISLSFYRNQPLSATAKNNKKGPHSRETSRLHSPLCNFE
ncbi:MAG: hypothetical protein PUE51_13790 [Veillonellaceae bacterium]|nr:hypothetical protein [Veillonellaceae bacterium]